MGNKLKYSLEATSDNDSANIECILFSSKNFVSFLDYLLFLEITVFLGLLLGARLIFIWKSYFEVKMFTFY